MVVSQYQVLKRVHIGNGLQFFPVCLYKVSHDRFDVLALDELEKVKTCRVQEIVFGHRVEEDPQDRLKELSFNDLAVVVLVVQADASTEIFEGS